MTRRKAEAAPSGLVSNVTPHTSPTRPRRDESRPLGNREKLQSLVTRVKGDPDSSGLAWSPLPAAEHLPEDLAGWARPE